MIRIKRRRVMRNRSDCVCFVNPMRSKAAFQKEEELRTPLRVNLRLLWRRTGRRSSGRSQSYHASRGLSEGMAAVSPEEQWDGGVGNTKPIPNRLLSNGVESGPVSQTIPSAIVRHKQVSTEGRSRNPDSTGSCCRTELRMDLLSQT